MPDEHKNDLVMKFRTADGEVDAECALEKQPGDRFMDGFTPQTYDSFSNFFELSKFSFGFEVQDESKSKAGAGSTPMAQKATKGPLSLVTGDFASWRSATDEQAKDIKFQLEFESFRFERLIDSASPIFFKYCCGSKSFESAVMVKRVSVGAESKAVGYLRIEFKDVLITSLSWDDGDMTTEKCEFICREFLMKYRRQKTDGSLDEAIAEVSWKASDELAVTAPTAGRSQGR